MWLGTTWEKQEGRFLLGSGTNYPLGSTGGSSSVTLTKANLPAEKLQIDSFSLGRGTMEITGQPGATNATPSEMRGAFYGTSRGTVSGGSFAMSLTYFQASRAWTGMSTSAAPYTTNMGSGEAFNNMPPYLVINIWKRLS